MEIIGLDLHQRESPLAIKADDGTITDRRIATSRERFTAALAGRAPARILLEASTESGRDGDHLRLRVLTADGGAANAILPPEAFAVSEVQCDRGIAGGAEPQPAYSCRTDCCIAPTAPDPSYPLLPRWRGPTVPDGRSQRSWRGNPSRFESGRSHDVAGEARRRRHMD
jgi:hypothetical protein